MHFRASERKRELIKFVLVVATSVAICLIITISTFSITISRLGVSDLSEALVQLNFTSMLHKIEVNETHEALAAKHQETAESVTNTAQFLTNSLNLMATDVAQLLHQVKVVQFRMIL